MHSSNSLYLAHMFNTLFLYTAFYGLQITTDIFQKFCHNIVKCYRYRKFCFVSDHNHTLEHHKSRLRNAGYKLTHARLTVLGVIQNLEGHCTSAQVLEAVAKVDESVGRASVFRTLDLLTQLGIIRPTYVDTSMTPQYVMMPNGHHHHIICSNCNKVIEFDNCGLAELTAKLEQEYNLNITGHLLEFYAECKNCDVPA